MEWGIGGEGRAFGSAPSKEVASAPAAGLDFAKSEAAKPADVVLELPKPAKTEEIKREKKQRQPRAGMLTAGSLNDQENAEDFRDFLSTVQQSALGRQLPSIHLGERVMIEVQDADGQGLGNVQVAVTQTGQATDAKNEGVLLDTWTRADGRTYFASGLEAAGDGQTFELTVRPPKGKPIVQQVSLAQMPWVVKVPESKRELPNRLDLALVVDTTGSMGDELNFLKLEIDHIASTIHRMYPNVDQRYSLIVYRDEQDAYVRRVFDFTGSLDGFRKDLASQSAHGGGDYPEAMHVALEAATKLAWRRDNTARVLFLVADAPPHVQHLERTMKSVRELRQKGVAVYPLAGSGAQQDCEFVMRTTAFLTRGQYLFLTDHSGVGNPHAKPTASKYEVEPLDQLMIRMIASELSGKPVLAKEVIATEESDGSEPEPIPQEQNDPDANPDSASATASPETVPVVATYPGSIQSPPTSIWDTASFRIVAALVLIAGILLLDNRLRA